MRLTLRHASIAIAILTFFASSRLIAADRPAGLAEIVTGTVTAYRAGRLQNLTAGSPVFVKDRLAAGPGSSAEIAFIDGSRMKLASNTSLAITEYRYNPAEKIRCGIIYLISGKARFKVKDFQEFNDRRFRVRTRTAIVASRDTDFIVVYRRQMRREEVCPNGMTAALCAEHSIVVFSLAHPDAPTLLIAGMISRVCGPNPPTPPRFSTPAELARILAGLGRI